MNFTKRLIPLVVLSTMLSSFFCNSLVAEEFCIDNGGCGYSECCRTTSLAPWIGLGLIAVAGIYALAAQNQTGHAHCHAHD